MKMKKFMNAPETVTDEELAGLGLAYPDILDVDGHLVISKDLASADRVTTVTYGGSGHEPAQAGLNVRQVVTGEDIQFDPNGEDGGIRVPMASSKDTVATVAEALCRNLDLKAGDRTFVMINGCGATTMMEMLVLFKDTVEFLKAKGVEVVASMVGEILTVQEAGGFQMNIAKWDDEFLRLWNTPCHTPAFSKE